MDGRPSEVYLKLVKCAHAPLCQSKDVQLHSVLVADVQWSMEPASLPCHFIQIWELDA